MTNVTIIKILPEFGIKYAENITQVYKSAWNIDEKYILNATLTLLNMIKVFCLATCLLKKPFRLQIL
jgi:hypothetical protein